jgi:hypothetical protein
MAYITAEDIVQAKQMDLLTYLQSYEPQGLVLTGPREFKPSFWVQDVNRARRGAFACNTEYRRTTLNMLDAFRH